MGGLRRKYIHDYNEKEDPKEPLPTNVSQDDAQLHDWRKNNINQSVGGVNGGIAISSFFFNMSVPFHVIV